jgi:hypothetical protein
MMKQTHHISAWLFNNRLKLPVQGRSVTDARLRTRAAA